MQGLLWVLAVWVLVLGGSEMRQGAWVPVAGRWVPRLGVQVMAVSVLLGLQMLQQMLGCSWSGC